MKKVFPYILALVILVSALAPFSPYVNSKKITVKENTTTAVDLADEYKNAFKQDGNDLSKITMTSTTVHDTYVGVYFDILLDTGLPPNSDSSIAYSFVANNYTTGEFEDNAFVLVIKDNKTGKTEWKKETSDLMQGRTVKNAPISNEVFNILISTTKTGLGNGEISILAPGGNYTATLYFKGQGFNGGESIDNLAGINAYYPITSTIFSVPASNGNQGTPSGNKPSNVQDSAPDPTGNFECLTWGNGLSPRNCFAQFIYHAVFKPAAWLFAAAGSFFDVTFMYSVMDSSYRMPFIAQGWALVRDFVNLFFIFVLLYAAISIILDLNHGEGKKMIIYIVVIGFFINFSLFATQVIIDTSNILARVFYNNIKVTSNSNNQNSNYAKVTTTFGASPISEGLVNKINPQNLVLQANKIGNIDADAGDQKSIGVGTFILVTLLAIGVCIIGTIVFFSVGLIMLARVIGLALAMVLAPIAFFTYTVPKMRKIDTIGIDKWFPQTISLAFLAPVFIFFVYLIIQFVQTGLGLFDASQNTSGILYFMSIIIPFAFIMILLKKGSSIAQKMSGEMGQAITSGLKVAGGVALGGAALGVAALGRGTVGAVMKNTQNDTLRKNNLQFKDTQVAWQKSKKQWYNPFAHANTIVKGVSGLGKAATAGVATGLAQIGRKTNPATGQKESWFQRQEKQSSEKVHSEHVLNDMAAQKFSANYGKDVTYKDLKGDEQEKVRKWVNQDQLAREMVGTNFDNIKEDGLKNHIKNQVETYHKTTALGGQGEQGVLDGGTYTDINGHNITGHVGADHSALSMAGAIKASAAMGEFIGALRKGSYDVRNISKLQSSNRGFPKMAIGLTAAIASGVRLGLKKGVGVEHGTGQKDFFKDLGHTVTEAMKGLKMDIKMDSHGAGGATGHGKVAGGH